MTPQYARTADFMPAPKRRRTRHTADGKAADTSSSLLGQYADSLPESALYRATLETERRLQAAFDRRKARPPSHRAARAHSTL